jgi:Zn-dependent peptidase ImmA (M78 family)
MRRDEIEKRASQILRDHGLLEIPVDPLKVAKALEIKVMNAVFSDDEKSGAIVKRQGAFSIFVNANEPASRKRFTIAHEIGHKLLHMEQAPDSEFIDNQDNFRSTEAPFDEGWTAERRREWEANTFAAALLMNQDVVREAWKTTPDPVYLAWKFQVSPMAMTVRLNQLGIAQDL